MNVFEAVKTDVTAREAAERYGIRVGRNGMARCPFHDDRHPSMKVDRRFHCFGCQEDGDVIDLTGKLFGLTPKEAAVKLADDFGISYDSRANIADFRKKKGIPEKLGRAQEAVFCIRVLTDYLRLLEAWETEYRPEAPDEEWHPRFVEALDNQSYTEYLLDVLLSGSEGERDALLKEHGKEVKALAERISGYATGRASRHRGRGNLAPTGTDGR